MPLTFITRPSPLARWQTRWVIAALHAAHPQVACTELVVTTEGDRELERPLPDWGDKAVFSGDIEAALLEGRARVAVHSFKDLPARQTPGLTLAAVPVRADARDVLVSARGYSLETLPAGACVATSSLRRAAQLLAIRPDLAIAPLRGNVETRLRKARLPGHAAVVMAAAGLIRLGLEDHITSWLPVDVMMPAPGQGALAVQCRLDDSEAIAWLKAIDNPAVRRAVTAESSFVARLGGGCSLPIGAYAEPIERHPDHIYLRGLIISPGGQRSIKLSAMGTDPEQLGATLAARAIARGALNLVTPVMQPEPE